MKALVGAHHVGATDGDPGPLGRSEPAHLGPVLGTLIHHLGGDDAVGDDFGVAVDVLQEEVQDLQALSEAGVKDVSLGFGQQPGNAVDRE